MTAALIAAAVASTAILGLTGRVPANPWRARRARREAAELAAWEAYRAAFYAPLPSRRERIPLDLPRLRPARVRRARLGPRFYVVRDPVE